MPISDQAREQVQQQLARLGIAEEPVTTPVDGPPQDGEPSDAESRRRAVDEQVQQQLARLHPNQR